MATNAPVSAQSAGGGNNLVLPDPAGDPGPFGMQMPSNPVGEAYGHIDIQFLEIGNDAGDTFEIILGIGGYGHPGQPATQALSVLDFHCYLRWTYHHGQSDVDYGYGLYVTANPLRVPGEAGPGSVALQYRMYYRDDNDYRSLGRDWNPEWFRFDESNSAFVFSVPKSWAPVWPGGHGPGGGDALLPEMAYCTTDVALYGQMYDFVTIPEGARYNFRGASSGGVLAVGLTRPDGDGAGVGADPFSWEPPAGEGAARSVTSVAPGVATKVPVYLANNAASRKLVQLSASFLETAPAGWNLTLTPSLMVPAGEVRTVHLIVTPPADAPLGTAYPAEIRVEATGEDLAATTATDLRVTPILDETHNTFYLHSQRFDTSHPVNEAAGQVIPPYRLAASLLESEPGYDDEPAQLSPLFGVSGRHVLSPLVRPVRLDVEHPVQVTLAFDGDPSRTVGVRLYLSTDEGNLLAVETNVAGDGVSTVEGFLNGEDVVELEPGQDIYFEMLITPGPLGPESVQETAFLATGSNFVLPVMPGGESLVVTDGRFLPSLALGRGEDATTYVNPGSEYAFDLVLSNEGVETDDLRLDVNATNATGWDLSFLPGNAFRVQPGNSTPFSFVAVAPEDAVEGDRAVFDVIARSKHDPAVRTELRLSAVVTTGVQVEAKPYEAREGQLDPLQEEHGEAPGIHLAALLVALACAALVCRRRG